MNGCRMKPYFGMQQPEDLEPSQVLSIQCMPIEEECLQRMTERNQRGNKAQKEKGERNKNSRKMQKSKKEKKRTI